jgi:glycerol-3-phosphate dehydrogenase (NAD(P)+)
MKAAVLGGGAWGTALAAHLVRAGHEVRLWVRETEVVDDVNRRHVNSLFLPGIPLPEALTATGAMDAAVADAPLVVVAVPSEFCRDVYRQLPAILTPSAVLLSATKGLEIDTLRRMTEVAGEEAPAHPIAVISGPSFAAEVAREQPTALVVACRDAAVAEELQRAVSTRRFRAYSSDDVVGVELAGALKNVIAIAAGISDGLGYGHNTVAALLTRGLAEMTRLAVALGGKADTLAGLAGLGDLVLTATGDLSRNRRVGQALGAGQTITQATSARSVAEGVRTTLAACALADRAGVDMPIARHMRAVLHEGQSPREAVDELMLRTLKRE